MKSILDTVGWKGIRTFWPVYYVTGEIDTNITDLLVKVELATSKTQARQLIKQKGIKLNHWLVTDPEMIIKKDNFTDAKFLKLSKGKSIELIVVFEKTKNKKDPVEWRRVM